MESQSLKLYLVFFIAFQGIQCQRQQIFFPRAARTVAPECISYVGSKGYCRLLVQCATFFAEIAELSRSPCTISEDQQGVCCPPNKQQTADPSTVISSEPTIPFREIVFPPVTTQDLNTACQSSLGHFEQRVEFTQDLVNKNVIAEKGSPEYLHSRLFETTNDIVEKGLNATIVLQACIDLQAEFQLDKTQTEVGLPNFSVLDTIISSTCPPTSKCDHSTVNQYRTFDGSCNNINNPDWGKTGITFQRMLRPEYQDGISTIRLSSTGQSLPSAREVSLTVSPPKVDKYNNLTILIWQWGQFLDHDFTHTPISKGANKSDISCCTNGQFRVDTDLHPACFPITIPETDPFYSKHNQRCMDFVRSMPSIRTDCKFGPREQMNQITSYIDASNVYGSTKKAADNLREFKDGLLRVSTVNTHELLPGDTKSSCRGRTEVERCFVAGDTRVNEQPDLAVVHTIWFRQHNKVVRRLKELNPTWSDEVLFQEGRRIIVAQMQHITYNEYLPIVLGREFMETFGILPLKEGYFRGYKDNVDATALNSFATAGFRYGHTLITDTLQGFGKFGNLNEEMELSKTAFAPFSLYNPETLDSLIRGLTLQQSLKFDRFFSEQLTNKLFARNKAFGLDLVALNLQRGRDHGLPPYTKWRKACLLPEFNNWADLKSEMSESVISQLQQVYESVHDIDLFIGAVAEQVYGGSLLGPTFLCIVGRQFITLKIGDRFFYENAPDLPGAPVPAFTEEQLNEIRKTSLARVFCDNSNNVELMQPLALVTAHLANKRAVCDSDILIPKVSLDPWKEQPNGAV